MNISVADTRNFFEGGVSKKTERLYYMKMYLFPQYKKMASLPHDTESEVETKHPISKAVGKVVIAVPLIIKLLELQNVTLQESELSKIKNNLEDLRSLDMLMVTRLDAKTENMDGLTKGRSAIEEIKQTLIRFANSLPPQDAKLTPSGLIHDGIVKDIDWSLKQFDKKIKELIRENPALSSGPNTDTRPHLTPGLH